MNIRRLAASKDEESLGKEIGRFSAFSFMNLTEDNFSTILGFFLSDHLTWRSAPRRKTDRNSDRSFCGPDLDMARSVKACSWGALRHFSNLKRDFQRQKAPI